MENHCNLQQAVNTTFNLAILFKHPKSFLPGKIMHNKISGMSKSHPPAADALATPGPLRTSALVFLVGIANFLQRFMAHQK